MSIKIKEVHSTPSVQRLQSLKINRWFDNDETRCYNASITLVSYAQKSREGPLFHSFFHFLKVGLAFSKSAPFQCQGLSATTNIWRGPPYGFADAGKAEQHGWWGRLFDLDLTTPSHRLICCYVSDTFWLGRRAACHPICTDPWTCHHWQGSICKATDNMAFPPHRRRPSLQPQAFVISGWLNVRLCCFCGPMRCDRPSNRAQ